MKTIRKCVYVALATAGVAIAALTVINIPSFAKGDLDFFPAVAILVAAAGLVAGAVAAAVAVGLQRLAKVRSVPSTAIAGGVVAGLLAWGVSQSLHLVSPPLVGAVLGTVAAVCTVIFVRNSHQTSLVSRTS